MAHFLHLQVDYSNFEHQSNVMYSCKHWSGLYCGVLLLIIALINVIIAFLFLCVFMDIHEHTIDHSLCQFSQAVVSQAPESMEYIVYDEINENKMWCP